MTKILFSSSKDKLLTRMIRIYGFEHPLVIDFAEKIDSFSEYTLEQIVKIHEEYPIKD